MARTPTRIDLAGGTLDLYPLYLMEEGGLTVNCAIDMFCAVTVEERADELVHLASLDLGIEERFDDIGSVTTTGELEIVARALKFFRPSRGVNVTTENRVKKGSGLGASSSLLIAALEALNIFTDSGYSTEQLIDIAADLEAQCIRVPTGKQDYFAASFGGVSALWFDVGGASREPLMQRPDDIRELEKRLVLSFTGTPRFSGITNWNMIKNYIEGDKTTVAGMKRIREISLAVRDAIAALDWHTLALMLNEEWQSRRQLAEGVTTGSVDAIMAAALDAGALANKICGAGGGGCMITCVEPERRHVVEAALTAAGAEVLPFTIVNEGITIERGP
jgi:D-glycero-alpha-D-manno-heptose-7-phosphate kinase